jgi:uncharacterized membrane protein
MMHNGYPYGDGFNNNGTHWGILIVMLVALVAFLAVSGWVIVTLLHQRGPATSAPGVGGAVPPTPGVAVPSPSAEGLRILNERLARGEIGEDEYRSRRALIEGSG